MNIILLGPPGSGKGTQAKNIARDYGVTHLSTGEIFRKEITEKTELGQKVESYVKGGTLVPDALVVEVVVKALEGLEGDFLLDGFPRTVEQAQALDQNLKKAGKALGAVLYVNVAAAELVKRLGSRWTCPKCNRVYNLVSAAPAQKGVCDDDGEKLFQREDDMPHAVEKRLMVYEDLTAPLVAYYRSAGSDEPFFEIDGAAAPDEVFAQVKATLAKASEAAV